MNLNMLENSTYTHASLQHWNNSRGLGLSAGPMPTLILLDQLGTYYVFILAYAHTSNHFYKQSIQNRGEQHMRKLNPVDFYRWYCSTLLRRRIRLAVRMSFWQLTKRCTNILLKNTWKSGQNELRRQTILQLWYSINHAILDKLSIC